MIERLLGIFDPAGNVNYFCMLCEARQMEHAARGLKGNNIWLFFLIMVKIVLVNQGVGGIRR
jgi:hypothetical protein